MATSRIPKEKSPKRGTNKKWKVGVRTFLLWLGGLLAFLILLFSFRRPILRGMGDFLVYEDGIHEVKAVFILSGSPYERGTEAYNVFKGGLQEASYICTGELIPQDFKAMNMKYSEAEITERYMEYLGVPDDKVTVHEFGTSTKEESDYILDYCLQHNLKEIMVVSTKFHTRRVKNTFKKKLEEKGIKVYIHGAAADMYREDAWWENEYGLIALNNEYVKLVYYMVTY